MNMMICIFCLPISFLIAFAMLSTIPNQTACRTHVRQQMQGLTNASMTAQPAQAPEEEMKVCSRES